MRLQPYRQQDAEHIAGWVREEEGHAKWCANLLPYPLTPENFHETLITYQKERNQLHFTAVTEEGTPTGFCFISPDYQANSAFMGFVIVDSSRRGKGYGRQMIALVFQYVFTVLTMDSVTLRVYENNPGALKMYEAAGMTRKEYLTDSFSYKGESWNAYLMEKKKEDWLHEAHA